MNVWEKKSPAEAIAAGRRPETVDRNHLLSACLLEVEPTGKTSGKVVWQWHVLGPPDPGLQGGQGEPRGRGRPPRVD